MVPKPGDPGSETWKDKTQRVENGRRRHLADRLVRSGHEAHHLGHRQSRARSTTRRSRPGDNLYTNSVVALNIDTGKLAWYFQYTPNDSWDYDEVGVHMLYDTTIDGSTARSSATSGATASTTRSIAPTADSSRASQYVNDLNWTKGLDPKTGKPVEYNPKLDVQIYNPEARALRGDR